jgi:hypothetical protein
MGGRLRTQAWRAAVAVITALSIACGGRGCSTPSDTGRVVSAVKPGDGRPQAGGPGSSSESAYPSPDELRQPVSAARRELALALGLDGKRTPATVAEVRRRLENAFAGTEAADRGLSRETFDVPSVAVTLGGDRDRIFKWIRENTQLVPYRGALRGAQGVLMDRRGNSLDRTLLLAEMLQQSSSTIRLAHARLSSAQAATLIGNPVAAMTPPSSSRTAPPKTAAGDPLREYAAEHGVDETRLRKAVADLTTATQAMGRSITDRMLSQAIAINAQVGLPDDKPARPDATDAMRDHWWVQYLRGTDWVDLDLTAADGRAPLQAEATLPVAELSDDIQHRLVIRLLIEKWTAGSLHESTVMEHVFKPIDALGKAIVLRHRALNWPKGIELTGPHAVDNLHTALLAQKEWQPVLSLGSTSIALSSFTDNGDVSTTPGHRADAGPAESAFGGLFDATSGDAEQSPAASGQLSAEWIEFELQRPGDVSQKIRRTIFDLIGPGRRSDGHIPEPKVDPGAAIERAAALAGDTVVLPLPCELSPEFVQHLAYTSLLAQRDHLRALAGVEEGEKPERILELASSVDIPPYALYNLALSRHALSPASADVYLDQLNVIAYHARVRPAAGGGFALSRSIDIVWNDVQARTGTNEARVRLLQGVADTMAEAMFAVGCRVCGVPESVAEVEAAAQKSGTPWIVIRTADDAAWRQVKVGSDARQRMLDDLRAGYVVRLPANPVLVNGRPLTGWWRIDPRTGDALGVMESGQGQSATEYIQLAALFFTGAAMVLAYWDCEGEVSLSNKRAGKTVACLACTAVAGIGVIALIVTFGAAAPAEVVGVRALVGAIGGLAVCAIAGIMD